jgi:cellulose synthase/poly-beta-1,6-N-acetylglucosamine synthase-like glycosyltransferase
MASIPVFIFYILIFLSVYVQVFFLVTLLENRKKIITRSGKTNLSACPSVTIVVPGFNEERTIYKTVRSLLALHYPKEKIKIFLIDDGSNDGTWDIMQKFTKYPNVRIFRKKNGGKYTALNLGLEHMQTDFFGGLDADSFVDPDSLSRIMSYFAKSPDAMAVVPSVTVDRPGNFIQNAQNAEYSMGIYFKKMLDFLGAINVTPGPLTIFRREVFDKLGVYRHGHNTEDMEIAYRMQKNNYRIEHCNDAYVYTNAPKTIKKLYKQRLRWVYGFINNTIDYRDVLFRRKYGNFSLFTLPMGIVSIFSVSFFFGRIAYNLGNFLYSKYIVFDTIGWQSTTATSYQFDSFFFNTESFIFLIVVVYFLTMFAMVFGRRMLEGKWSFSIHMLYFFPVFSVIAPFWLLRAIYNTLLQRKPAWR